ncbi:DUF6701 domain-containing protein [Shewanella sp. A14]
MILIFSLKNAFAFNIIDASATWPLVAQGHHKYGSTLACNNIFNTQLVMYRNAKIRGALGRSLAYCSRNIDNGFPTEGCDNIDGSSRMCSITQTDFQGLKLTNENAFLYSNGNSGVGYCNDGQQLSLGSNNQNQFNSVSLYSSCTLTMSSARTEYRFNKIALGQGAKLVLPAGDYWINSLELNSDSEIILQGDARIFINNDATFNSTVINQTKSNKLQLIAYNNLTLNGSSSIAANIYANEKLTLNTNAAIAGRVSSRYLEMSGNTSITDNSPTYLDFHIQYGKSYVASNSTQASVVFDKAFPTGVTPLVFVMPTISTNDPENDGPQSVFLSNIDSTGFTLTQAEPPSNAVDGAVMSEVHWIAVIPGTYTLSNGTTLTAGSVEQNKALMGSNDQYKQVVLPSSQNVQLNQLQTQNNNCWLTSTAQSTNDGIELAMDASEVRTRWSDRCQPGNLNNYSLQYETIAYLAVQSGSGTLVLDGENVNYHFGSAVTINSNGNSSLSSQCSFSTPLIGFTNPPLFVASKTSRRDNDGGWLRRCLLSNTAVSMVTDEDQYRNNQRRHTYEHYSFVAFEKKTDPLTCFSDDFNRNDVGDDWALKVLGSSLPPSIVSNRLRFTSARGNQATSSTYQRLFPAADNLVEVEFDYFAWSSLWGTGADGIAVILSDASKTPQPGSFGGALGYAQRNNGTPGFAGGWLGIALDEYGNFSSANEGKVGGPGFRSQAVAIRGSAGTSYRYLTGTNANINPKIDVRNTSNAQPNHRYKIIIDSRTPGKAMVSVLRDTLNRDNPADYETLIAPFDALSFSGQAPVPKDFYLSITGSTGGSNNNHEMDNFKVCALKSNPVGQQVHHFEFDYSSSPFTCKAETMTVRACKDASVPCNLFTDPVEANLSLEPNANGAWYVEGNKTNVVQFEDGVATVDLRNNVITPITIGVTSSVPSTIAGSDTLCRKGGGALNIASCTFSFAESGFIFDVPDKLANKPTDNITIRAVKTSDVTQQCIPLFSQTTKNVDFWSSYIDPITPINGQSTTVNSKVVSKLESAATTLELAFDTDGKAELIVNYPDAGKMQLDAKYTGTGDEQGLIMLGSDQFVSFPVGLCVTPEDISAKCSAGNSSCDVYKKAGESFNLIIQGKAWESDGDTNFCDNINTPNYAHNDIELGHQLVDPDPKDGVLGAVGSKKYNHIAETTNRNTVSQSVSEVGVFQFTAKPKIEYLESNFYDIPLATSPAIGRFVPDRFVVSRSSVLPSCGSFTYMDQPFSLTLTLSAFNIGTDITKNYQGAFAKANAILVGENSNNGIDLSGRLSALPINTGSWVLGEASVDATYLASFKRMTASGVDGPFSLLDIGVQVFDNDGNVSLVSSSDMRPDTTDNCVDANDCTAKWLSTQAFRHGRVVMDNTFGPEDDILRMPTYAQYWNGSDWITNVNDNCTQVIDVLDGTEIYAPLIASDQTVLRSDGSTANIAMSSGQLSLLWQNTGSKTYRGQVTAPLQVEDWLKWYWNWDQVSPNQLYDPRASAFFGRYRGHDRIIYWREVGQ